MDKKLMWFFAMLLTMLITTIAVQYFWIGNLNPAALLGIILGAAIGWLILSRPKKSWTFWVGTLFWVLFVPAGILGFIRFLASQISIELTTWTAVTIYILGVLAVLFFSINNASLHGINEIHNQPLIDERVQAHYSLSGFWAFIFINLLIMGALLQPWIPLNQLGLWIGVLVIGLLFWGANLLILERKG